MIFQSFLIFFKKIYNIVISVSLSLSVNSTSGSLLGQFQWIDFSPHIVPFLRMPGNFWLDMRDLPVICWILQGNSPPICRVYFCVALSSLVGLPANSSCHALLGPPHSDSQPGNVPWTGHSHAGATVGLPSFVSCLSGTTVVCWLMLNVLETIVSHILSVF